MPGTAVFRKSDIAKLLETDEWVIASFTDPRYPYRLAHRVKGRGQKSQYSLLEVYKFALADRMHKAGLESDTLAEALRKLFRGDLSKLCMRDRSSGENARCVVVERRKKGIRVNLLPRKDLAHAWESERAAAFVVAFDELLNRIDSRIGLRVTPKGQ